MLRCALLLIVVLSPALAVADRFASLRTTVDNELRAAGIPGAAMAIVEGDQVVFASGFGLADVETGEAVRPEMLFRLGSTTKMFTALAVVALAEQGKLQLDLPIGKFVAGLSPAIAAVTADQLLSHTAGLRDELSWFGPQDESALGEAVRSWNDQQFFTAPGSIYSYSNPGYRLAGFVVEQTSGKPFADRMRESVFEPLGMHRTTFRPTLAMTFPRAQGHSSTAGKPVVSRPAANSVPNWPSGSMFSSVQDLARFTIAFMNEGRLDGRQVLSAKAIRSVATPHAETPGDRFKYGYGWEISTLKGERMLEHAGAFPGYGSQVRIFPDKKVALIVLANLSAAMLPRSLEVATAVTTGINPETVVEPTTAIAMSLAEMERYVGRYTQGDGDWELLIQHDKLFVRMESQLAEVTKVAPYRFTVTLPGSTRLTRFRLVPDDNERAEYLFRASRSYKRRG